MIRAGANVLDVNVFNVYVSSLWFNNVLSYSNLY